MRAGSVTDSESAFFQHMRKPKMTGFGEVYYEGAEYEVRLTDRKPGQLSDRLRVRPVASPHR